MVVPLTDGQDLLGQNLVDFRNECKVVSLRDRVSDKMRFDLMARARRPWRVDKYPTLIEDSRDRPGQLKIGRSFEREQDSDA